MTGISDGDGSFGAYVYKRSANKIGWAILISYTLVAAADPKKNFFYNRREVN